MAKNLALSARLTEARNDPMLDWDYEKNGCDPESLPPNSRKVVSWRCHVNPEHEWMETIASRVSRGTCPGCDGSASVSMPKRKPKDGMSIAEKCPHLVGEWYVPYNGDITPYDVSYGISHNKYWWKCSTHGVVWVASPNSRTSGSGCPKCRGAKISKMSSTVKPGNSLASQYPDIAREWLQEENGDVTPDMVTYGTRRKFWFRCDMGHKWEAILANRTCLKQGCPYCAGQRVIPGENDLASCAPHIAKEWHPTKNGTLTPESVTKSTSKKVWWLCPVGHEYHARISNRWSLGLGCPVCSGQSVEKGVNDITTTDPNIAKEWHPTKNGTLTPESVSIGSHLDVWWLCDRGHEYQCSPERLRRLDHRCPYCDSRILLEGFNDLASTHHDIACEWDYEKNGTLTPNMVTARSTKFVWWKCDCGNEWKAQINIRARTGCGCQKCGWLATGAKLAIPKVGRSIADKAPHLVDEWDSVRNGSLTPADISYASGRRVWWKCDRGHSWQAIAASRVKGSGCPYCNRGNTVSFPEKAFYYYVLRAYPDAEENVRLNGLGRKEVDILLPSINTAIEYDGVAWHKDSEKDLRKDAILDGLGIRVIRVREPGCPTYDTTAEFVMRDDEHTYESLDKAVCDVLDMIGASDTKSFVDSERDAFYIQQLKNIAPRKFEDGCTQMLLFA